MFYDFDISIDRRESNSHKWANEATHNAFPLSLADMDFMASPAILNALSNKVKHGVFGYSQVPDIYYQSIISWFERRYHYHIKKEWILYTTGILPAISATLKAITHPDDKIIVMEPAYNRFFSSITNAGCHKISTVLKYSKGKYTIDFNDLERCAADTSTKVLLLCNPHNPTGRAWSRDELIRIGDICYRHGVIVISDEVHCDLVYKEISHVPFDSIPENANCLSIICVSPSKAFNLSGLKIANIIIKNITIRSCIEKQLRINDVSDINVFAIDALIAAYNESEQWLEFLKLYIHNNYILLTTMFNKYLPCCTVTNLQATFLCWIDCSSLSLSSDTICKILRTEAGVVVNSGSLYGESGNGFIRINIACKKKDLSIALLKIIRVLRKLKSKKSI